MRVAVADMLRTTDKQAMKMLDGGYPTHVVYDLSVYAKGALAVLKAELDLALTRSRTPEEIERTLRNASTETDRLIRLAEDLTVLKPVGSQQQK